MIKNFIPKSMLFILLLFGGLSTAFAQTGMVKGVIVDASTGSPLPGATVQVKGTTRGTVSDLNGNYSISVNANTTLVFSYVGYVVQEIAVQPNTTVKVELKPSAANLNELVVIGYGTVKKSDLTGSVTAVNTATLPQGLATSMTDMLQGHIAGMNITSGGGAPGAGATVRIRGGSSIYANNDPLYIVDGVPLSSGAVDGQANPLSFLNPEDIQTVTVLKDASATAIYGSRASNGVVIITTKKGSLNQKMSISYSGNTSISTLPKMVDVLSADAYRSFIKSYWGANSSQAGMLGTANTNWQKEIYQNAISQNHYLSLSGAAGKLPYRVSVGYTDQNGILKTTSFQRTTAALNLSPTFLKGDLQVNFNVNGAYSVNSFGDNGAIGSALAMDPTQPVYSQNGGDLSFNGSPYGNGYFMWMQNGKPVALATANPLSVLTQKQNDSWVYQSTGSLQLDYKLHWIPELKAHLDMAYDISNSNGAINIAANSPMSYVWGSDKTGSAEYNPYYQAKTNALLNFYLNYNKTFGVNNLNVMGGYSWQHYFVNSWNSATYATNPGQDVPRVDYPGEYYLISFFGRLNYTLKDKYLLTATIRDDGSSRFDPSNRWGLFPSVAAAWKINDESFLKGVKWLSNLKLRLSVGETGQQDVGSNYYTYLPNYTTNVAGNGASYVFGNNWYQLIRPNAYNTSLKWESTTTYNAGLDFGFLNERIRGSVDVYKRVTNNLLNTIPVAAGTNFTNNLLENIGSLENTGVEVTLGGTAIATKNFTWNVNYTMAYNQNKITKLTRGSNADYPGVPQGNISGGTGNTIMIDAVGHPLNAYYVYHQLYDANGKPIEGAYASGGKYISKHSATAPWTMGFSSRMNYKNWYMNFAMHANIGNYVYNNVASGQDGLTYTYVNGYLTNTTPGAISTGFNVTQYLSDYFIQNASFLRMDNITLGYNLNKLVEGKLRASIYGTVQNLFVITKYKGLDPEVAGGIDNNVYPTPRIFILGLKVNFK
ncbi:MAG: TonB-dependent receptor [Bacteroidales bacterium]|nr:TonB-dependent receptor [Bacteroidales bacterium]